MSERALPTIHKCNGCGEDCVDDAAAAISRGMGGFLRSSTSFSTTGGYCDLWPEDGFSWRWRLCEFCLADLVSTFAMPPTVLDTAQQESAQEEIDPARSSVALATRDPEALAAATAAPRLISEWTRQHLVDFAQHRARRAEHPLPDVERLARAVASIAPSRCLVAPLLSAAQRDVIARTIYAAFDLHAGSVRAPKIELLNPDADSAIAELAIDGQGFGACVVLATPEETARHLVMQRLATDNDALRALLAAVLARMPEGLRREAEARLAIEDAPAGAP